MNWILRIYDYFTKKEIINPLLDVGESINVSVLYPPRIPNYEF